ncbi:pre-mRNA processing RNA-helicase [Savitreella phatthalungensis]
MSHRRNNHPDQGRYSRAAGGSDPNHRPRRQYPSRDDDDRDWRVRRDESHRDLDRQRDRDRDHGYDRDRDRGRDRSPTSARYGRLEPREDRRQVTRASRFDQPSVNARAQPDAQSSNQPLAQPSAEISAQSSAPRRSRFDAPRQAREPNPAAVGRTTVDSRTETDEKLKARQERLLQWKRQKLQGAAPMGQVSNVAAVPAKPAPSSSVMTGRGFGKIGMSKNQEIRRGFDFEESDRQPSKAVAPVEDVEDDPLEAFMADNAQKLKHQPSDDKPTLIEDDDEFAMEEDAPAETTDIMAIAAKAANARRKDIPAVDHSKEVYEHFNKEFYVEPPELAAMTDEQADGVRLLLDGIAIRGKDCPKPVQTWGQCGLPGTTLDVIRTLGYDHPSPIQAQAMPAIMSGRDVIGVAKTGSGKTVAFLLPMFRHIKDQRPLAANEGPIGLILTPTRELATQIFRECRPFLRALNLRAVCAYGGSPIAEQIADLRRGAEIVVCTPGRMIDLLAANNGRVTNLRRVTYCVLDEADRMFDMGFEPQVTRIVDNIQPDRQTILFSATFPRQMENLAKKVLKHRPLEIVVGGRSVVAPEIKQIVEVRAPDPDPGKFARVLELLGELYKIDEDVRTLIFVERQDAAESLLSQLMRRGYPCDTLHGGKDQFDRDSTIRDFKNGVFPVLIATSVAARGLDVRQLKLVINYDCPNHLEDYVHRVGRTGRAGQTGTAVTFVGSDQQRYAHMISKALKMSKQEVPEQLQLMADAFDQKLKAGQEKVGWGFGGTGLDKFDSARDTELKQQRKEYGEDAEGDVLEAEARIAEEDAVDAAPEPTEQEITAIKPDAPVKIERIARDARPAPAATQPTSVRATDPVAAARARIEAINNRIRTGGQLATPTATTTASTGDATEFRAMLEINDYPQKARWGVTNRSNIARVLESTGTSITTQGQYVKPGSVAPEGIPKLYLLIEGTTEAAVSDAVHALRSLLLEGAVHDAESGSRYKVV